MKTVFGIFARDVKLLLRNPVALLVVGALLVLPGLYAWYCIIANWDPYSNTGNVPIAVVNEDRGATSDLVGGEEINIGAQVVDQLRENDSIKWVFYDNEDEALEDTRMGLCYAALVMPETLSEDVIGIFDGSPTEPTVYYYPNQKPNAVATKVSDSAAQTLVRSVNRAFSSRVNTTIISKVQGGANDAEQSADKMYQDARAAVQRVRSDIDDIKKSLDDATSSIEAWRSSMVGGQDALAGTADQLPTIRSALDEASGTLSLVQRETTEFDSTFSATLLNSTSLLSSVSTRTSSRAANVAANVTELAGGVDAIIAQLRGFRSMVDGVIDLLGESDVTAELGSVADEVDTTLEDLEQASANLQSIAGTASEKVVAANENVQQATEEAEEASNTFSTEILPELSAGSASLSSSLSGLSAAVAQFEPQVVALQNALTQADDALVHASEAIDRSKDLLTSVGDHLDSTMADLGALDSALEIGELTKLLNVDSNNVGEFISSPVKLVTEEVYPVSNYGTAVAPFYTNLALWIGCFILISIIRLEVDRRGFETATATQRYFGRWLLLVILALLQSQVICGVDILLGIDCSNPALFMLVGAVASFCYMNLIYALTITFRNIGKTLCILLLIMQVPGSSGMYPIEMMPAFFQAVHPFLAFTYGIDAMREALCGMYGNAALNDILVLLILLPLSLLLGVVLRPRLLNLVQLFDHEMAAAGFFASEEHGQGGNSETLRKIMRSLSADGSYRDELEERTWAFNRRYPRLRKMGTVATFAIPYGFLFIMLPFTLAMPMSANVKLTSLVIMLIVLLVVMVGLIVLEYMHRMIEEETRLLGQSMLEDAFADADDDYLTLFEQVDNARHSRQERVEQTRAEMREAVEERVEEMRESAHEHAEELREAAVAYIEETVKSREAATSATLPLIIPGLTKHEGQAEDPEAAGDAGDSGKAQAKASKRGKRVRDTRKRLGVVREIFFTDLRLGFRSVIGVVVTMLLVITPSLYAWFNIAGSWDPYSSTDGLKVAVANEDEGYKGDLLPLTVNIGDSLVSQLRASSSFHWQFVSEEEAIEGIRADKYYASIVIPADFSKNMMTYLTDDAEYPDVVYYTNKKENPIAPLITQKGADSIQESIRTTFTERVDEVVLSLSGDLMEYLTQPRVVDYARTMEAHLDDAIGDMHRGADEVRALADLTGIVMGVVDTAGTTMDGITAAVDAGKGSINQAETGIAEAASAFEQASALVEEATAQNTGKVDGLADDIDAALTSLQEGAADAPEKLWSAHDRVNRWEDRLIDVQVVLLEEAAELSSENGISSSTLSEINAETRADLVTAAEEMQPIIDALEKMRVALENAATDSEGGSQNVEETKAELRDLYTEAKAGISDARLTYDEDVKGSVEGLKGTLSEAADSTHSIMDGLEVAIDGLADSTGGLSGQLQTLSGELLSAAGQLDDAAANIENIENRVNDAVNSGDVQQLRRLLLGNDAGTLATRLAAPIKQETVAIFPVENYGSSMAPFYTVLSLWVGALVMISTMKVHLTPERAEELRKRYRLRPHHEYLGRYGIFSFISLLQSLLVSLGDLFLLHIQCVHPVLFVLFCIFIGQVFCLMVYTFTELFGDIGKAVCIILLIMQVAASGGTFAIEMLGANFEQIVPYLPFYHGMSALQGCVAGFYLGDGFIYLAVLLSYVLAMLIMGMVVRRPFRFVTDWVEGQLEKTGYL